MKQRGRALDTMLYMVAAVVIAMGALGAVSAVVNPPSSSGDGTAHSGISVIQQLTDPFPGRRRINVLLLGSDELEDVGRSDTIMVLSLNPRLKRAALLSIPRDSRVEIPGHGLNKINSAYAYGGVELAQETVEQFLGIRIHYYVQVGFDAFVEAVDELGGVEIEIEKRMYKDTYYDDIDLQPGYQHLDGKQALQFVRYRNDSDIERAKRQQQFLRGLTDQKFNVMNLTRMLRAGGKLLDKLNTNVDWRTAYDFMRVMRKIPATQIMTATVPIRDKYEHGIYYGVVSQSALRDMLDETDDYLRRIRPAGATLEVRNGSGVTGAAQIAADALSQAGFKVADLGNADSFDYDHSVINHRPQARKAAQEIKQALKLPDAELVAQRHWHDNPELEVVVVLGQDFDADRVAGSP